MRKKIIVYIAIIMSMAFWSLSFVWYKSALEFFQPLTLILFRLIISSVLLFAIGFLIKKLQIPNLKDFLLLIQLSVFTPLLYFIGECYGMKYVSPTVGSVIISTIPLFTPFAGYFIYREKLNFLNFTGIFISLAGVLTIVISNEFDPSSSIKGILLLSVAVFSAIVYSILLKKIADRFNSLSIVTWQNSIGVIFFIPLVLIFEYEDLSEIEFTKDSVILLLELSIFASSIAFILYAYSIKELGIAKANVFTNAIPAITAIFAFFVLDEMIGIQKAIGIIVVIAGLFLSQIKRRNKVMRIH